MIIEEKERLIMIAEIIYLREQNKKLKQKILRGAKNENTKNDK